MRKLRHKVCNHMRLENVAFNVHKMHDLEIYTSEIQTLCENVDLLFHVVPLLQHISKHVFMYVKANSTRDAKGTMEQRGPPNLPFRICTRIYPSRVPFPNLHEIGESKLKNEVAMPFRRTFASPTYFVVSAFSDQSLVGTSQRWHRTYLL